MKQKYTQADCDKLRRLMVESAKAVAAPEGQNYLLLSGGIDSVTALYSLMEAGIPFKALTFHFKGYASVDKKAVEILQQQIGFKHEFVEIPSEWETIRPDVVEAVRTCYDLYKRIREVKVETIFALRYIDKFIPAGGTVYSGANGDAVVGYNKTMAIMAAKLGEEHPHVMMCRTEQDERDEFIPVFSDRHKYLSIFSGKAEKHILNFTMKACNYPNPKSIFYYAFADYHKKYSSYRKPKAFQKASNEKAMFNIIAIKQGYKNALEMFRDIYAKEVK